MGSLEFPKHRTAHTKTKTGCRTCKIRRVKCDEARPCCNRCLKFGVICDGYDPSFRPGKEKKQAVIIRELIPRKIVASPSIATNIAYSTCFQDNQEYRYFLHFQEETSRDFSGPFTDKLWSQVLLRASQGEPALCRLVSSIGALTKAAAVREAGANPLESTTHQQYALWQYGRAIKGVQQMISSKRNIAQARFALIAGLLIFAFESVHGDYDTAIKQMEMALPLMKKELARCERRYKHLENTSPTSALEDELVVAFVRIDNHLLSRPENPTSVLVDSKYVKPYILDVDYCNEEGFKFPHQFTNIEEARFYLEQIQFSSLPRLAHEFHLQALNPGQNVPSAEDLRELMGSQHRAWRMAFAPLYAKCCSSTNNKEFVAAATLRVSVLSTDLASRRLCNGSNDTGERTADGDAREIIGLGKMIVGHPSFKRIWVFDCGAVPGLFIVVISCRNKSLRQEAFQLLKSTIPRREGCWDSVILTKLAENTLIAEGIPLGQEGNTESGQHVQEEILPDEYLPSDYPANPLYTWFQTNALIPQGRT
ncbi:hypothetical protein BGZ60DRAFT_532587 [Tricladium varicosporioides]|nr:hypothetical protein BGZ60DRAFT_532587 [Hymenoscyphus varicosporioides]